MPFQIIRNDIIKVKADILVNTANPHPVIGDGTDRAVYQAAGEEALLSARKEIGEIAPGDLAVTPAFDLNAKYIFHVVGPIWQGGESGEEDILRSCYQKSLQKAKELDCDSIAFPLMATGSYRFPKDLALQVALSEISAFLTGTDDDSELSVLLVVFDPQSFSLSEKLITGIKSYIDDHYVAEAKNTEYITSYGDRADGESAYMPPLLSQATSNMVGNAIPKPKRKGVFKKKELESKVYETFTHFERVEESVTMAPDDGAPKPKKTLEEAVSHLGETFQERLLRLIDESGMTDAQVYKRANMSRQLFSKIRSNKAYSPTKRTALALAIALELNLDDTSDLIGRAGYAFSPSVLSDMITQYCIENKIYNIFEINALLFEYEQAPLGA